MSDGILNICKSENMTSHDVVYIVRKALGEKKVGHTGTLDPMATGVLPVCVGKATRVIEYMDLDLKEYRTEMLLGKTSDTADIWGRVTDSCPKELLDSVREEQVLQAMSRFRGVIQQIPPLYSSVRIKGRHLYQYARAGEMPDIPVRTVYIDEITPELIDVGPGKSGSIRFRVRCGKGTYIRSITRDIGEALGTGAVMSSLVRTRTGVFSLEDAVPVEELKTMSPEQVREFFYPVDAPLGNLGRIDLEKKEAKLFAMGIKVPQEDLRVAATTEERMQGRPIPKEEKYKNEFTVYCEGDFLGIGCLREEEKILKPEKVILL